MGRNEIDAGVLNAATPWGKSRKTDYVKTSTKLIMVAFTLSRSFPNSADFISVVAGEAR